MMIKSHGYPCRHFYRIMTLTPTARFHIGLVNNRWYKDALQRMDISNNEFVVISLNASTPKGHSLPTKFLQLSTYYDDNQIGELETSNNDEISKVISRKRKFGELFGLGRKVMSDVIEDGDEDTYREVLEFFQSIQQKRSQKSGDVDGNISIMEIRNPVSRRPKGRPKLRRIASVLEESNAKVQYKCKTCKQIGHNSKTCKGKENQGIREEI